MEREWVRYAPVPASDARGRHANVKVGIKERSSEVARIAHLNEGGDCIITCPVVDACFAIVSMVKKNMRHSWSGDILVLRSQPEQNDTQWNSISLSGN